MQRAAMSVLAKLATPQPGRNHRRELSLHQDFALLDRLPAAPVEHGR